MDKIRIGYFLEDLTHEGFVKTLVERIANKEAIGADSLIHEIRSARGGSKIIPEFKKFIRDTIKKGVLEADLLVVAIDGNCKGYSGRVKELEECIKSDHPFKNRVVYAVPDPYIERWYIMDQRAFKKGIGLSRAPMRPPYKCEKGYYQRLINQTLKEGGIYSLLGAAEYAEKIVNSIENLESQSLGKQNPCFRAFVKKLKKMLRNMKSKS